ncbi:MAG: BBP7 family outer membrane beta-barrel protein [Pirellulaceae bacterium]
MTGRSLLLLMALVHMCLTPVAVAQPGSKEQAERVVGFVPAHLKAASRSRSPQAAAAIDDDNSLKAVQQIEFVLSGDSPAHGFEIIDPTMESIETEPGLGESEFVFPVEQMEPTVYGCPLLWGRAEYLLWWTDGMQVPALATSSPAGTLVGDAGVLGQTGTSILFGNEGLNDQSRSGGRFTLGSWFDPRRCEGLEFTYLMLGRERQSFSASNIEFPILARPFFNVVANAQDARRIAFPAEVSGSLDIQASTSLQAFEALYRVGGTSAPCQRLSYVLGYRYAELKDRIGIRESTLALSGALAGTTFDLLDDFRTQNQFHGGELGIVMECQSCAGWSLETVAKVALGSTRSRVSVFGETTTTIGAASTTTQAGLLALPTNIGTVEQSYFSTVSEFGITMRRYSQCGLSVSFGYTFLYWSDVARAGDQIDVGINTSQIPPGALTGLARPVVPFDKGDFWAQGLRCGLDYAF